jgi:hypothetical protein
MFVLSPFPQNNIADIPEERNLNRANSNSLQNNPMPGLKLSW